MTGDAPQPGETAVERDPDGALTDQHPPEPAVDESERPDVDAKPAPEPDPARWAEDVPDVMVLPEPQPDRNRPTEPPDHNGPPNHNRLPDRNGPPDRVAVPVPGQLRMNRPRTPAAELDVKRSRMENSPFWLTDAERAAADNTWPPGGRGNTGTDTTAGVRARTPQRTWRGLLGLITLALVATFFSWVSAEPFWLAVGHGRPGVATVTRCTGSGVTQRCAGTFTASDGTFTKPVTLLGVDRAARGPGAAVPARMVNSRSKQAYVGTTGTLLHLRWVLGFALVLLCGLGIAGLTGTRRLETAGARRGALMLSFAGPLVLLVGFLLAAY